ncbi:DUF1045 domain-containing protein [Marimonas arenosa]|uniref:DUF1045 domain-containing protein n=1 Tax=Marimonas arenosa TaxID=1795305 RepID=A0AAE4B7C1_9RHOB|nr:DUF1045 domain-containing protein [Marimonas arenosa]MDQ2091326.1 DUF1045 domain-containing protein [Marimonas arenosa]
MPDHSRYAVFYAPPPGALADFGAAWLGWDAADGACRSHPVIEGLPRPVEDITETPRKYGFHGTLKPPFRLAAGSSRAALEADLAALAERHAPVILDGLMLARLGGFLALVPEGDTTDLSALAADCVRGLDTHRAPPSHAELEKRRHDGLTPAQQGNLDRWGYPYVMEAFHFHLTLTGRLPRAEAKTVKAALAPLLKQLLPQPFRIGDLCLFGEAADGRFHILTRHPLGP